MTTAATNKPPICAELASFPTTPGVYAVYTPDYTSVLYVGKAATQTLQQTLATTAPLPPLWR
jgi:hypothetical protein